MGLTGNFGSTGATGAVGPATRVEFGFGADGAPLTYVELTRQISLLQRQNVVVEKAMQWYKREAEEWKALALLLMNPKQAQPAPVPELPAETVVLGDGAGSFCAMPWLTPWLKPCVAP